MELVKLNKNNQIVTSSRVVAEKFGKRHDSVLRDIDNIISNVGEVLEDRANTKLWTPKNTEYFMESKYTPDNGNGVQYKEYLINKDGFMLLVMGFTGQKALIHRLQFIEAFNDMEQALNDIRFRVGDKKHQLEMMELLHGLLPEEMQKENINYIKANTVVNKCVSDVYGFPKMLSKKDMNSQMLETRSKVLEDYIKLFDILEDNSEVKAALYKKYERKQLA